MDVIPTDVDEPRQSLWALTVGPAIWAGHFLASYIAAAVWCGNVGRSRALRLGDHGVRRRHRAGARGGGVGGLGRVDALQPRRGGAQPPQGHTGGSPPVPRSGHTAAGGAERACRSSTPSWRWRCCEAARDAAAVGRARRAGTRAGLGASGGASGHQPFCDLHGGAHGGGGDRGAAPGARCGGQHLGSCRPLAAGISAARGLAGGADRGVGLAHAGAARARPPADVGAGARAGVVPHRRALSVDLGARRRGRPTARRRHRRAAADGDAHDAAGRAAGAGAAAALRVGARGAGAVGAWTISTWAAR